MLRSRFALVGLSTIVLASALAACSSESGETDGLVDQTGAIPPAAPTDAPAPNGSENVVFAVSKLYLGDTDRAGTESTTAWKSFGYNLDGKISTKDSTDLCKPVEGATKSAVYPDGNDGIDNAFGKSIVSLLAELGYGTVKVNEELATGSFTLLLDVDKIGTEASYSPLTAKLYGGQDLGAAPKNDGTDTWPLIPELLDANGDAKLKFPSAYLADNTFVSGTPGTITIALNMGGIALSLNINKAVISADLSADRKTGTNGVIAGVLKTSDLLETIGKIDAAKDMMETVAPLLEGAADILSDGTQDPNKTCDAISVGLGFDLVRAQLGEPIEEEPAAN